MERRTWLSWLIKAMGLAVVGAVGVPSLIKTLSPVLEEDERELWRAIGPVSDFPEGSMRKAVLQIPDPEIRSELDKNAVYVWRKDREEFIVYSRSCTDLGCPVTWDPGSEWFYCPCHGGIFNKKGEREAGPPKRPLWRYENRVREGVLEIDLRSVPPMA